MAHLIDKDALVAYIRSRLQPVVVPYGTNYDDWDNGADNERLNILSFLDTLEVKEVDLENNLKGFQGYYAHENGGELPSAIDIAKHFFELGLKAKQE